MGCDIHLRVEVREDGRWVARPEQDFYEDRNYGLFAILANVRNGVGFAGIKTGDGYVPICEPKGVPVDLSPEIKASVDHWGEDGHSHSWLTVQEIQDYDWTRVTNQQGVVTAKEWYAWSQFYKEQGVAPAAYCGAVSGPGVVVMREDEMAKRVAALHDAGEELPNTWFCTVQWAEPYTQVAREFLSQTLPRLWRLGAPSDVRIVFWFDN